MKKRIKNIMFFTILFLTIGIFIYLKFKSYNYEVNYNVEKYKIYEKYNKENNTYTFLIKDKKNTYPYSFKHKYVRKKELIKKIKVYTKEDEKCIIAKSDYLDFYPVCINKNLISYNISNIKIDDYKYKKFKKNKLETDKLTINYLNNTNFLLYNYKGFNYIKENKIKNINLLKNDIYTLDLIYELNEFIIIPDYNEKYYFDKFFVINLKNGKVKELKTETKISFDSIFLGDYKNNVYFLDKKEEKEYKINPKKLKIKETDYLILKDNKLIKTNFKDIINSELSFERKNNLTHKIINNKLYKKIDKYKVLITDKEVNKIIKEENNTIYYLSNEKLYMYNNTYGEILLMSNFEWNFNNTNKIYLYK